MILSPFYLLSSHLTRLLVNLQPVTVCTVLLRVTRTRHLLTIRVRLLCARRLALNDIVAKTFLSILDTSKGIALSAASAHTQIDRHSRAVREAIRLQCSLCTRFRVAADVFVVAGASWDDWWLESCVIVNVQAIGCTTGVAVVAPTHHVAVVGVLTTDRHTG